MNRLPLLVLAFTLFCSPAARAQLGGFGDIQISSEQTRFEGGVAIAERNVVIRYGESVVYCDYAQYNADTHDVLVTGNVRIYREGSLFTGERAVYNLDTKQITAADFRGNAYPFAFAAESINTLGPNAFLVRGGLFTTSDNSKPDYKVRAKSVRVYPNDRMIMRDATVYVGDTPVFYFPYLYQSLNKNQGFLLVPGWSGTFGAYVRSRYSFPITNDIAGTIHVDGLSKRGIGLGLDASWDSDRKSTSASAAPVLELDPIGKQEENTPKAENRSWGRFRSYYIHDSASNTNKTALTREPIGADRYRVSLQNRTYFTEDIFSTININKLSDTRFLQDFEPGDFRTDPNPDNMVSLTKWDENYTATLTTRKALNEFFDSTERLPELALDIKRQPIFGRSGLFYDGQTSAGFLRRHFAEGSLFDDYDTFRADTFHQLTYPTMSLGWLSIVPKLGVRATYYGNGGSIEEVLNTETLKLADGTVVQKNSITPRVNTTGATVRLALNAGIEASFKLSRAYEQVQSRAWGLDGLRHIIQPYTNLSYVYTNRSPDEILQFDRINPSTKWQMLDFPQFDTIDSIDRWAIARLGVFNRFQTRRDDATLNWLELNTFFDINIERPEFERVFLLKASQAGNSTEASSANRAIADNGTFSNVHSLLNWQPLGWMRLAIDSQFPIFDDGYTEINTNTSFLVNRDLQLGISHRYIDNNPFFSNSNYLVFSGYLRLGDNWGVSAREAYEFETSRLQQQSYTLHRDLSSWVASFGFQVTNNGSGKTDLGLALTFTLKDLPQVSLPLAFDPNTLASGGSSTKNP